LLYLPVAVGLVAYTSSTIFLITYVGAGIGLGLFAALTTTELTPMAPFILVTIGVLSGAIGLAIRRSHTSERDLETKVELLRKEKETALQIERDRIADELHDIIAHEVTIIGMHADVLARVDDEGIREKSVRTIQDCSQQVLTDIRRMLNIVRQDAQRTDLEPALQDAPIREVLEDIEHKIVDLGGQIEKDVDDHLSIPASIEKALVHIAWECGTNIIKHASDLQQVHFSLRSDSGGIVLRMVNP